MSKTTKFSIAEQLFFEAVDLIESQKYDSAIDLLEKCRSLAGDRKSVLYNLAFCHLKSDRAAETISILSKIPDTDKREDKNVLHLLSVAQFRDSGDRQAGVHTRAMFEKFPDDALIASTYIRYLRESKKNNEALSVIENGPWKEDALIKYEHLWILFSLREYRKFIELAKTFDGRIQEYKEIENIKLECLIYLGLFSDALEQIEKLIQEFGESSQFLLKHIITSLSICSWDGIDQRIADLFESDDVVDVFSRNVAGLFFLPHTVEFEAKRRETLEKIYQSNESNFVASDKSIEGTTVAYCSADFRRHPVAQLIAPIIENQRSTLRPVGVAYLRGDDSLKGIRARSAFEQMIDIEEMTDQQALAALRELKLDIAVDTTGHMVGNRLNLFRQRIAPVQIHYLGHPGMICEPNIDYIIADEFTVPSKYLHHYREKIIYMPGCSYVIEPTGPLNPGDSHKQKYGIPLDSFVFGNFGRFDKLIPDCFRCWLDILDKVPASVLVMGFHDRYGVANLQQFARQSGIDPTRLYFLPRASDEEYLPRMAMLDLFLDTWPFGAQTTATDALNAEVPILTKSGETIAQRICGSLAKASGLHDYVVWTDQEYVEKAVHCGLNPERVRSQRIGLSKLKKTGDLFNPALFSENLEKAFSHTIKMQRSGQSPKSFRVADLP